ncbi:MAG: peptide deformylase [Alphaproteobacteria bacterium]|nr:peptide deformylase [Alphaproteobacteria bacterium]MCW5744149.1 peptide deformylase [Alphaproteobacteria bacterium]
MAIHPIVRFPDPRLRQKAAEVTAFDDALKALAADLLDTMRAAPGVGITGPHIGVMRRVVVIELGGDVRVYVNPVVEWSSPETTRIAEGSISMPGINEEVERPAKVRVRFRDLDGVQKAEEADGFRATCLQHEIDQLNGIFWIDRLSRLKRDRLTKRFAKLGRP